MIQIYSKRRITAYLLAAAISVLVCFQANSQSITNGIITTSDNGATTNLVQLNADGTLNYTADTLGNTLIDYGMVGYRQSVCAIPDVAVVVTLNPSVGDRTADIQAAIDSIEAMPQNQYGHRGALLLTTGYYEVQGELSIDTSGVVIRGEGNGTDGTVILHTGTERVSVLTISAPSSVQKLDTTLRNVVDTYVPIGTKKVTVESGHTFQKGDPIIFTRAPYQSWIEALGMDTLFQFCGDGHSDWTPSSYTIDSKHNVVDVIGDTIFFDSPVVDPIEPGYATAYIQKYDWVGIEECGVENIRFESQTVSEDDENHAKHAIEMSHLRNGWFRNIKVKDFRNNCTNIGNSYQITVDSCEVEDYVSLVAGGRRYGFSINGSSQLILVKNCKSNEGRHCFASGSRVRGPNVFYNCTATNASTDSGPHHRWATGFLYENLLTNQHLWVQNRVCSGSGHGWTGGQHLFWNCDVGGRIILQDPPTEQTNWAIGCTGTITNEGAFHNFDAPLGYVESHNNPISFSLYENQARIFKSNSIAMNSCLICPNDSLNDADIDGVCNDEDTCLGFDDNMDIDGDNIPDFCDCHPAVATANDGNMPVNTLDGDLSTRWSAYGIGEAIQYCLDEPLLLTCVDMAFFRGDIRSATFDIEILTNNDTWVTVLDSATSSGTTLQLERFTFPPTIAHKIRITGYGNSQNEWNSYTEVTWANCTICADVQLQAWLEGAYDPALGEMTNTLSASRKLLPGQTPNSPLATPTPAGQPYSIAPWNYTGTEGTNWTNTDYTGNETDWILVSFRTGISKNTEVAQTAALIMQDGTIELVDRCALLSSISTPLYIILEHRNHIGIMTPQPVEIVNGILMYDFRTSDSYRDATSFGQKQLPNGEWAMFAGDADQMDFPSFDVNGTDKTEWFNSNGVFDYYLSPDFNLDGDVNGQDKSLWYDNNGISSRVPK